MQYRLSNIKSNHNGDLMTLKEILGCVECGAFIDYDGMGSWATDTKFLDGAEHWIYPSAIKSGKAIPPSWATHVLWYNR